MTTSVPVDLPLDLGDGLVLRRATTADAEALAKFNARLHGEDEGALVQQALEAWTRDLASGAHPTFAPGDFTVVEDTRAGRIASSLNLISQTWTYAGLPFGVGRPELVATDPAYRNRGLVRKQFEIIHAWSAARGELVQAITGIPWYYRQFGYEMGLWLGGARLGYAPHVPKLPEGEAEPYVIRPATAADLPLWRELYAQASRRDLAACVWDEALWRYELTGKSPLNINRRELRVIETAAGEPVGVLALPVMLWGAGLACTFYELKAGLSWLAVTPSVIRYLWSTGQTYAAREAKPLDAFVFDLGVEHPAYRAAADHLRHEWKPYAWYVRVPDVAGFLRHITPVLEARLAASLAPGYTGELSLSFYRSGVRLSFEQGRLSVEAWQPQSKAHRDASFPDLTFLHLLFGHRSLDELEQVYRDCSVGSEKTRLLLDSLFPKQVSHVWPVS